MLRVEMLPAGNGDCLWIEYGSACEAHRILIDGGPKSTYKHLRDRILALPASQRIFELLVVTHIDNDHIEGILPLLQDKKLHCQFKEVWYNGWRHLPGALEATSPTDTLGPLQGEFLGVLLEDEGLLWNDSFGGDAVVVPDEGELPCRELEGGLKLTLLSPTRDRLVALREVWRQVVEDAGFEPGDVDAMRVELANRKYHPPPADVLGTVDDADVEPDDVDAPRAALAPPTDVLGRVEDGPAGSDTSETNGTSIALLAEYAGAKALLTGDAFAGVVTDSLLRVNASPAKPLAVDAWKLAHHGSWANFTPELFELLKTRRYLVSTNGSGHHHPHAQTLDYIIGHSPSWGGRPELIFNYRSPTTEKWADKQPSERKFTATYPAGAVLVL